MCFFSIRTKMMYSMEYRHGTIINVITIVILLFSFDAYSFHVFNAMFFAGVKIPKAWVAAYALQL